MQNIELKLDKKALYVSGFASDKKIVYDFYDKIAR